MVFVEEWAMKAFFFDMDGVLFDSMPLHAIAWEQTMTRHQLPFSAYDTYRNEGRTGESIVREAIRQYQHREPTPQEVQQIYTEKGNLFHALGNTPPIEDVNEVLQFLQAQHCQLWIVTGSAQQSLFDKLNDCFPQVFEREHMITAWEVTHGKPDPEPYRKAWERCGLSKDQCCVVENAPLGVQSGKAAGLTVYAVNTGILHPEDLRAAGADEVFDNMHQLLHFLQKHYSNS